MSIEKIDGRLKELLESVPINEEDEKENWKGFIENLQEIDRRLKLLDEIIDTYDNDRKEEYKLTDEQIFFKVASLVYPLRKETKLEG